MLNFFIQGQDPSKPIIRESDSRWEAVVDWATQKKEEIFLSKIVPVRSGIAPPFPTEITSSSHKSSLLI